MIVLEIAKLVARALWFVLRVVTFPVWFVAFVILVFVEQRRSKSRKSLAPKGQLALTNAGAVMSRIGTQLLEGEVPLERAAARIARIERWARRRMRVEHADDLNLSARALTLAILCVELDKKGIPRPCFDPR